MALAIPDHSKIRTAFGQRKLRPRACVIDVKEHIRSVLEDALENLGFVTCDCARAGELSLVLEVHHPNLVVIGVSVEETEAEEILQMLAARTFVGSVLLLGPSDSPVTASIGRRAEQLGLVLAPTLHTPFRDAELVTSVASLLPSSDPPSPPVRVGEAVDSGWLELWYQPEIDTHTLALNSAEALARIRHPAWGVVPPAYFIPDEHDPHLRDLSEFVIDRAMEDWHYLLERQSPVDLSINLPASYLKEPQSVRDLCRRVPTHPAFGGLTIEIDSEEAIRDLDLLIEIAREMRLHNIGLSIDNLGANWPSLMDMGKIPFIKLKADRHFVTGSGNDRLKRTVCRHIVELAQGYGVHTVAEGVESRADLVAANELGFDHVQGFLFGKPMPLKKFARSELTRTVMAQE